MSIIFATIGRVIDPCIDSPTVDSIANDSETEGPCFGGGSNYVTVWTVSITGTLQAGQQYYWEHANNAAGDNWAYLDTTDIATVTYTNTLVGNDGPGDPVTVYSKVRCWVVPTGLDDDDACDGPATSSQVSEATLYCVT